MLFTAAFVLVTSAVGQTSDLRAKNNPYSPSPAADIKGSQTTSNSLNTDPTNIAFVKQEPNDIGSKIQIPASNPAKVKERTDSIPVALTDIYRVGVGDVLFIDLKNSSQGSRYCTVQENGTIEFPLAGENLIAAGQTPNEIEQMLASRITLFADPEIDVKVREYSSHKINVSGMGYNVGEKSLQREAVPLFVIRSEAVVNPNATDVIIRRAPLLKPKSYDLHNPTTDDVLIYPGNSVEFVVRERSLGAYYISGEVRSSGQKELAAGLSLYQAVIASGTSDEAKKATIRRKDSKGLFSYIEYKLKTLKDGKAADPVLQAGDVIEVRK